MSLKETTRANTAFLQFEPKNQPVSKYSLITISLSTPTLLSWQIAIANRFIPNVAYIGFLWEDSTPTLYMSHLSIIFHSLLQIKKIVRTKSSIQFYTQYSPYISTSHPLPHHIKKVCSESGSEGIIHIPKSLPKREKDRQSHIL